jgi:MurNAc alpha-1-phosphate uridylyltransferase
MRPLTATKPKPLIEVGGKPLLDHVLERLRAAGVKKVVVNVHYLADAVEAHLISRANGLDIVISDERGLLMETGGGLVQAEPLIDCDPFLAVNSDNLWVDGPADTLRLLASHWDNARMDALLLLVPLARAENHKGMGDFHMDREGRLRRRDRSHVAPFVFTGIQMISKRLLRDAPEGPFSTNILWDRAIEEGRCFGAVHQGLWFDVGTPKSIPMTEAALENA